MPPKKKKSTPIVVGTVSTRSTRRESIVNIEIIRKANKSSAAKVPASKKIPKKSSTPNKKDIEHGKGADFEKTSPEILEILKDWSDDENSHDDSILSISSGTRNFTFDRNEHNSSSRAVDQQSLIDILEGNNLEHHQLKPLKETLGHEHSQEELPKSSKFSASKELIIENRLENPIINIDSPQVEDSEIIEECVVEDDSFIIELPEDQMGQDENKELNVSVEDISMVDNKLGSPVVPLRSQSQILEDTIDSDSNITEQRSRSLAENTEISNSPCITSKFNINNEKRCKKQKYVSGILQENKQSAVSLELSSSGRIDEESRCISSESEDTTSQSMITVQDEDALDLNDIQMSDNSNNNFEVIEEQVVFDTSEPIIIENLENIHAEVHSQKDNLSASNEKFPLSEHITVLSKNQPLDVMKTSEKKDLFLNYSEKFHEGSLQDDSSGASELSFKKQLNIKQLSNVIKDKLKKGHPEKDSVDILSTNIERGVQEKIIYFSNDSVKSSSIEQGFVRENSSEVISETTKIISKAEVRTDGKESIRSAFPPSLLDFKENTQNLSIQISKPLTNIGVSVESDSLDESKQNIQITSHDSDKKTSKIRKQEQYLNTSVRKVQSKLDFVDAQSEENNLCQKLNELMGISKESSKVKSFDPASDKLQEGMQKMHIQEKCDQIKLKPEITGNTNTQNNESRSSVKNVVKITEQAGNTLIGESTLIYLQTKGKKSLMDCEAEKSLMSCHNKKAIIDTDPKRRRSTRRKAMSDEAENSVISKKEESSNLQKIPETISGKEAVTSEINSSLDWSFHNEQPNKNLRARGKKVHKKEDIDWQVTDNNSKIFCDNPLDPNKDVKYFKNVKGKSKKSLEKHTLDETKMDIDSESSEAKTSEAEGDSTSNESSQSSHSTKMFKTRGKKVLVHQIEELKNVDVQQDIDATLESIHTEIIKSELNIDNTNEESNQNRKFKGTKLKKASKKVVDDEIGKMDIDLETPPRIPQVETDIKILQANIDATIDEVLRKYTQDEPCTSEECGSPKELKSRGTKPIKDSKKKKESKPKNGEKYETSEEVRRSDRIKTILPVKKKSHGLVRSKSEPLLSVEAENSDTNSVHSELDKSAPTSPQLAKKYKTKSRAKSSENLQILNSGTLLSENSPQLPKAIDLKADKSGQAEIEARLKTFAHLKENQYKTDRQICKEAREMICDCYLAEEDIEKDEYGCGEDCLNRLLMIECGHLCQIGDRCTNKRFQKGQVAPVDVFKTEKKGLGLIAAANIPYGEFILEYIGEVLNPEEFDKRAEVYSKDKNIHFYFMSLRADAIIDATMKGNISRFINHSCDPNAETQKWTVNGELRIGFFSTRTILAGEEITFDYKFQRYGKEAQKCYCEATTCRGWLGERPDESEDEDEEEEEETSKVEQVDINKAEVKVPTPDVLGIQETSEKQFTLEKAIEKMGVDDKAEVMTEVKVPEETPAILQIQQTPKKVVKKKLRKELLFEDFDQLNEDFDMVVTTGLKNQAHTLKLSRLMVRAKDLDQRKKLLRVLRRGELPCRRLFLDYHGLRLMHGYMIDAQQLTNIDRKSNSSQLAFLQTKLELLQTLAVLPIQNKTMLIESKVLPAVEKWAKNEDLVEDGNDQKDCKKSPEETTKEEDSLDPAVNEKIDEIKFLASKLLEEWVNLKESFRIPKKQRIEQMKEHEKEANRKFVESSYAQEKESSRKSDQRYRTWSRYKSERETNKKGHRPEDKDKPSAEYLKISKHERRKLFALQMELKEEERRLKQREMWRQHEMNCLMIGADPRFTAPFDPGKGFQYIWNPSIGQWQALPVPSAQNQGVYNSPATSQGVTGFNVPPTTQGVSSYNVPPTHKPSLLGPYQPSSMLNVSGIPGSTQQYPGMQPNIAPMVPGLSTSVPAITSSVPGMASSLPGITTSLPGITGLVPGITVPGITQPPYNVKLVLDELYEWSLPALPIYQEVKQPEDDPSQVKFAGPIPPPVKLPPKWKSAKDKYGRPYYYHVKIRKSQWEPPPLPEEVEESSDSSSSETSSLSSSDTSSDSDTDDEIDDTKLLMEVRKQMENTTKFSLKSVIPRHVKKEEKDSATPSPEIKQESDIEDEPIEELKDEIEEENSEQLSSIDIRLKEQFNLDSSDPPKKKRRIGLCQEIIISPRTEEDRQQFKEDLKRYKATKEKLKRQKEQMVHQVKKKLKAGSSTDETKRSKDKRFPKNTAKSRMRQMNEWNDEHAKKIKEVFRSTMATTVVGVLNAYRKPDCKESRITNTEDFKHLARKLTHFVMLKEMKHINTIEELICTDNVKAKAREYIKKYMSKFGEVYQKRHDEPDFKD